jgi:hypothetical protein
MTKQVEKKPDAPPATKAPERDFTPRTYALGIRRDGLEYVVVGVVYDAGLVEEEQTLLRCSHAGLAQEELQRRAIRWFDFAEAAEDMGC